MVKPLIWVGIALTIAGVGALGLFVVPQLGTDVVDRAGTLSRMTPLVAVLAGGLALAAGAALIGVGVGRWQRPTRSETLPLGQTRHSSEV
jgi:hypothetical protein